MHSLLARGHARVSVFVVCDTIAGPVAATVVLCLGALVLLHLVFATWVSDNLQPAAWLVATFFLSETQTIACHPQQEAPAHPMRAFLRRFAPYVALQTGFVCAVVVLVRDAASMGHVLWIAPLYVAVRVAMTAQQNTRAAALYAAVVTISLVLNFAILQLQSSLTSVWALVLVGGVVHPLLRAVSVTVLVTALQRMHVRELPTCIKCVALTYSLTGHALLYFPTQKLDAFAGALVLGGLVKVAYRVGLGLWQLRHVRRHRHAGGVEHAGEPLVNRILAAVAAEEEGRTGAGLLIAVNSTWATLASIAISTGIAHLDGGFAGKTRYFYAYVVLHLVAFASGAVVSEKVLRQLYVRGWETDVAVTGAQIVVVATQCVAIGCMIHAATQL
jgi:hypothetical protein